MSSPEWDESEPNKAYLFPLTFCKENAMTAWQAVKDIPHKKERRKKRLQEQHQLSQQWNEPHISQFPLKCVLKTEKLKKKKPLTAAYKVKPLMLYTAHF